MEQTLEKQIHVRDINYLLQKVVDKYDPLQIYCFHKDEQSRKVAGCFGDFPDAGHCDYWLLMVTEGPSRIENAIQDFVNAHYEFGKVTILAHGKEGIDKSINDGYKFFTNVFNTGKLLYNRQFFIYTLVPYPSVSLSDQERLKQRFNNGISRAEGFLHGAIECLNSKKYNVCAFMLHQAVEQSCIALIGLHMDYRCDIHNLHRLLMLCRCFSDVPYMLFITGSEADEIVFEKLVKSYSNARYRMDFEIEKGEIGLLVLKVSELVKNCSRTK
ncbi:HEPN domain-containing protein [Pedobacter ginsengisoli]|uniref:HEPN domain-containing protein n=1 Tax=Pedobacter ginsengisoli TaxID=363852 RepID=UPI0025510346|nr:HEPN domain-containing protein [Pedobacter ginsengisoli]